MQMQLCSRKRFCCQIKSFASCAAFINLFDPWLLSSVCFMLSRSPLFYVNFSNQSLLKPECKNTHWEPIRGREGGVVVGSAPDDRRCQKLWERRLSARPPEPISSEDSLWRLGGSCRAAAALMSSGSDPEQHGWHVLISAGEGWRVLTHYFWFSHSPLCL